MEIYTLQPITEEENSSPPSYDSIENFVLPPRTKIENLSHSDPDCFETSSRLSINRIENLSPPSYDSICYINEKNLHHEHYLENNKNNVK